MTVLKNLTFTVCCLAIFVCGIGVASAQKPLAIKGGKIITMAGDSIENGTLLFRDGKITGIGVDLKIPVEARVIDATGKVVMPGLVESHSSSGMSQSNETNPLVPYVSVLDSIDPMDSYFAEARRNGVTTVAITPGNSTMIGGQAAVIKTGGEFVNEMVLKSDAGVKISLKPVSGTRMSHLAKLRKALDDAKKKMEAKDKKKAATEKPEDDAEKTKGDRAKRNVSKGKPPEKKDAEPPQQEETNDADKSKTEAKNAPEKPDSDLDKAMFKLLSGELAAIIYCEKAMDVGQALRLIKEYGLKAKLVLGQECHKAVGEVAKSGLPVILDPTLVFWEEDPRTKKETKIVLPRLYRDHGVKFTPQIGRAGSATLGSNYLWYQAATCIKYGMPEQEALEALTTLPAKFIGVDKFVGTLEKGKDGDVVILSGHPLRVDTWVEKTLVNGEVVYDRDDDQQLKRLLGEKLGKKNDGD